MAGEVQNLIKVVNKLQDVFASFGSACPIDLPQIAVVGEQSAGKSSVLENFVGRDFLPRGTGIVTRRPLILQLINQNGPEYAEFLHCKGKKFTDFLEVRKEIELETDRVTGSNKNISPIPINLRVYSPDVLNLTLIDLPGLTKVPVGDQPKDIEQQIRDMIISYISSPNCLILAVTPAVIDLANSESLKLAKEVDSDKTRTIGVITKIDMMDKGTDCKPILDNQVYALKRGYVGIVNRSQRDIDGKKDIKAAQEAELSYFASSPSYRGMIDRLGSRYLQKTLNQQLAQHIKDTLPSIRQKVLENITSIEKSMGSNIGSLKEPTPTEKSKILLTGIQEFSRQVDSVLGYQQEIVDTTELSGGSIINRILYQRFRYELERSMPDKSKIKKEIDMAIKNSQGVRSTIFTPDVAFTSVVKKHIEDTRPCCLKIAELVITEVRKIIEKTCASHFANYPTLMSEIMSFCQASLMETLRDAKQHINFYVDIELAHINTKHPDFTVFEEVDPNANPNSSSGPKTLGKGEESIYKKGFMSLKQGFISSNKNDFFVLKGSSLSSYKDERMIEPKLQISLEGCRIRDYETNYSTKKNVFQVYHKEGKLLAKDQKTIDLVCNNSEEALEWKAAFMASGVLTDRREEPSTLKPDPSSNDINFVRQIQYIFALVDTYLKIVTKAEVDLISKICIFCIITKMRNIILTDVVAHVYSIRPIDELLQESEEVVGKRKEMASLYQSCKEALNIITEVMATSGIGASNNYSSMKFSSYTKLNTNQNEDYGDMFENKESNIEKSSSQILPSNFGATELKESLVVTDSSRFFYSADSGEKSQPQLDVGAKTVKANKKHMPSKPQRPPPSQGRN